METEWRVGDRCIYHQPDGTDAKVIILSIRERSASLHGGNPPPAQPSGHQPLVFTLKLEGGGVVWCGEGELSRPTEGR
ncbi:MAG: hypothetical protein AMXMBFR13_38880 [Phycisphaerae bacterium]